MWFGFSIVFLCFSCSLFFFVTGWLALGCFRFLPRTCKRPLIVQRPYFGGLNPKRGQNSSRYEHTPKAASWRFFIKTINGSPWRALYMCFLLGMGQISLCPVMNPKRMVVHSKTHKKWKTQKTNAITSQTIEQPKRKQK